MKPTGIVRRIDELGRVVIPKEIRRTMRIRDGEPLEIYVDREGEVILKKYAPINDLGQFAKEYTESLHEVLGHIVCVADRDEIIAVSGKYKKELFNKTISSSVADIINKKQSVVINQEHNLTDDQFVFSNSVISPIIANEDSIGAVIITTKEANVKMGDLENMLAATAASFLAKQMESTK